MPPTPTELCQTISSDLRDLQNHPDLSASDKVRIPAGVIQSVSDIIEDYAFVKNTTLRRNICYAEEALDFYRWSLRQFRTYGPISSYLYKSGIIHADMIVEAIVRDFIKQWDRTPHKRHSRNLDKLEALQVPPSLLRRMKAPHTKRSNIYLHLVSSLESSKYKVEDWNRSMNCLRDSRKKLAALVPS